MPQSIWVHFPVRSQFYIPFTFIYTSHQKYEQNKDVLNKLSAWPFVLSMFLKF